MFFDYHLHSEFSDDSNTPMEKQIERAIELGIDEICFTDHVDYGMKKDWDEGNIARRGTEAPISFDDIRYLANVNYPEYFAKLLRMREIYGKRITIKTGLEFGVQKHTIDRFNTLFNNYEDKLDFILLSIHQIDDSEFWTGKFMQGKTQDEYNMLYYEEMFHCAKNFDGYDVLAHVDHISRYDKEGYYSFEKIKDILTDIFKVIIEKGKGIELNTSSWKYGLDDTTPSKDILKLYKSLGGKIITIGSDSHTTKFVGDHLKEGIDVLRKVGFENIYTYKNRMPIAHSIGE